ncbi:Serine/threonine-protein phosphatase PGAM5, mitochondrial [Halotydeus destructor]|nr:Serine/threonine-protein phosphatase PGAM5, mitochondrial [Halotydeus destructor]
MSSILRGSKKLFVGLGLAGCAGAAAFVFGLSEDSGVAKAASYLGDGYNPFASGPFANRPPSKGVKWDFNWDKREPDALIKPLKGRFSQKSDEDNNKYNEKLEKAKAIATRHLILVRHGQYNLNGKTDEERFLTELGREQAKYAGMRLKELGLPYTRIVQSTMTRATETAQIVCKELPNVPVSSCNFLREGAPIAPEPPSANWKPEANQFHEDGARIEAAFRRYFHRADASQKEDSYEVLVCHANVIRYFICRALQFPAEGWLRFSLHNCSLTWLAIRPSGRVTVYSVGDIGHVPPSKMTTT